MRAFRTMFKTELKLSLRGVDMVIFAICLPVVTVILLGVIFGAAPAYDGAEYTFLEQSLSAVSTIAICAGGVMGLPLLISDYRHRKVLKRFQVTPASPVLILAVHVAIYALYALVSLLLVFITAAWFFQCNLLRGSVIGFAGSYLLVMISMFSIGLLVGGVAPDVKTAGILASVLYFPMLIFSGATLPYEMMPHGLQIAADILPLTQGIKLLKNSFLGLPADHVLFSVAVLCTLTIVCCGAAVKFFQWEA